MKNYLDISQLRSNFFSILLLIMCLFSVSCSTDFDKDRWADGSRYHRKRMAKSLIESKRLEGLTFEQTVDLLGQPDHKILVTDEYEKWSENDKEFLEQRLGRPDPGNVAFAIYYFSDDNLKRTSLQISFRNNRVSYYGVYS